MSTATLPAPTVPDVGDDDFDHIFCACDPNTALCGYDLTGAGFVDDAELAEERLCPMCVLAAEMGASCCGWRP